MSIYKVYKDTDPAGKFNEILADEDFVKENYSSDGWSYEIVNPPVLSTEDQKNIKEKNEALANALKTEDKESIENCIKDLSEVSAKMAEMMYAEHAKQNEDSSPEGSSNNQENNDSEVVDAEYKEVNSDKK